MSYTLEQLAQMSHEQRVALLNQLTNQAPNPNEPAMSLANGGVGNTSGEVATAIPPAPASPVVNTSQPIQQSKKRGFLQTASRGILGGLEGALLTSQGRPLSEGIITGQIKKITPYDEQLQKGQADLAIEKQRFNQNKALMGDKSSNNPTDSNGQSKYVVNPFDGKPELNKDYEGPKEVATSKEKQSNKDNEEWDKVVKDNDPTDGSSRTVLGQLGNANYRIDKARITLNKPTVTKQDFGNVMTDIAGIYQNGAPTELGMSHQDYQTLYGKFQAARQELDALPTNVVPPEIKAHVMQALEDLQNVGTQYLGQHLRYTEVAKSHLIEKFPKQWKAMKKQLLHPEMPSGEEVQTSNQDGQLEKVTKNGTKYQKVSQ